MLYFHLQSFFSLLLFFKMPPTNQLDYDFDNSYEDLNSWFQPFTHILQSPALSKHACIPQPHRQLFHHSVISIYTTQMTIQSQS